MFLSTNKKNISFLSEKFQFLVVKFSMYLKRRVFVMNQPEHPRSLIRGFANRMCLLQPPGYLIRDNRDPCHTG